MNTHLQTFTRRAKISWSSRFRVFALLFIFGIIVGLIIITASGFPYGSYQQAPTSSEFSEYEKDDITIRTTLSEERAGTITRFVKEAFKDEFIPTTLVMEEVVGREDDAQEFASLWYVGERVFQVLYVPNTNDGGTRYMRAWVFEPNEEIQAERAVAIAEGLFQGAFMDQVEQVACGEILEGDPNGPGSACGVLGLSEDGNKRGFLVRSPIQTPPGPVAVASACLVPKESDSFDELVTCF